MLLLWPKRQIYQEKREDSNYAKIDQKWYTFRGGRADLLFTQRLSIMLSSWLLVFYQIWNNFVIPKKKTKENKLEIVVCQLYFWIRIFSSVKYKPLGRTSIVWKQFLIYVTSSRGKKLQMFELLIHILPSKNHKTPFGAGSDD